jgi:uncharacterized membrane protein YkvA (DUF1232 family)
MWLRRGVEVIRVTNAAQPITIELNPGERRIWDRLRSQVVAERDPGSSSGMGDMLCLLPDLTVLLLRLLRDGRVPLASKAIALAGVGYVISPIDLMPALLFGPIGLVDDLIVVAASLSVILNRIHPDVVRSHWSGQGDALDAIQAVTGWVESDVVGGISNVLGRIGRFGRFGRS